MEHEYNPYSLEQSTTIPLTRALAEEMRTMKPSPTERELDPKRVEFLRQRAEADLLVPFCWAKARINGEWMRMNGQHSSEMLCNLPDETFPEGITVHLDEYLVGDMEGLSVLFQQFDARRSSRSSKDVAGAYLGLHEDIRHIELGIAKLGADGVIYYQREVQGKPTPAGDLKYKVFDNESIWPFLLWMPEVFNMKTPELRRPPIVAAMFATYEANQIAAMSFWRDVQAGGNVSEENHPTRTLDLFYQRYAEETDRKKKPKPHELYQAAILAWNSFREGKRLATIKKLKTDPDVSE